ncbi:Site-specific recombinase, phage integrase family [Pseudomonas coronafaciens pv. striafaciens]|nr:Site-specific recombinase, phage integrase family [Pseudomonas coronafaciens pv. striafaciens]
MATLVKTPSGTWKALIRKTGWPTVAKTFRTKRDAEDWSRRTEDEMVRGVYIQRSGSERMTLEAALKRYLSDITPTKKPTTQRGETSKAKKLIEHLGIQFTLPLLLYLVLCLSHHLEHLQLGLLVLNHCLLCSNAPL